MAKLSHGADTWRSEGLLKKYKAKAAFEPTVKYKAKKDTNKWCRGKVGVAHVWHRYQSRRWSDEEWAYVSPYVHIKCIECGKEKYAKTAKMLDAPLHIWVDDTSLGYEPIQVCVNGQYLPIAYLKYQKGKYWCSDCGYWH